MFDTRKITNDVWATSQRHDHERDTVNRVRLDVDGDRPARVRQVLSVLRRGPERRHRVGQLRADAGQHRRAGVVAGVGQRVRHHRERVEAGVDAAPTLGAVGSEEVRRVKL